MKIPVCIEVRGWQITRSFVLSLLATLAITSLGCQSQETRTVAPTAQARNADDLMVVDCLLPGQVRKLGQSFTFLAPRRAIKTTGTDCEIRGGEYVAYDRASYATALKIWLPEAKAGDPTAMVYVGEIYEKGLGVVADYQLAQHWYLKAAELGDTRAQINLGYLYESGLGVERDLTTAMKWYRRASGLTDGELEFVSSVELAERQAVTAELGALRAQSSELRERLAAAEARLAQDRRSLAATRKQAADLRRELENAPAAASVAAPAQPDPALQRELERAKAEQRRLLAELSGQQHESAQLRSELNANQSALAAERRKLAQLHVELANAQSALKAEDSPPAASETPAERALREDMQSLTRQLATNRDEISRLTGLLAATDTRNHELQQELAMRDREISSTQAQLAAAVDNDAELARMQAMLGASQQERRRLADELALVELKAAESEAALAQTRQELALRQSALASAEQTVAQMQQKLDARRRSESAATDAQIASLSAAVMQREQQLAEVRSQVQSLERSLDDQVSKAEQFAAEAAQRRSALDAALQAKDTEIDTLNARLAAALRDNEKLGAVQRQLASADAERRRLATELAEQDLATSDLKKELGKAQQTVAQGSAQLSDMREALRLMQDQLAARDRDLATSTQRSIALESEVAARTAALDRQNREVARLEERLLEQRTLLESQLAKAQGEQQQLQQAAQERQRRVEDLERKLLATQVTLQASERKAARLDEVEKKLEEEQNVVTAQEQELAQLRKRLEKEKREVAAPAIAAVTVTQERGPVIEIIDPPLAATRGIPSVLLRSPVREVELVGRVRPEEKLLSFKVNEKSSSVDEQGLFRESVALREPQTSVNLVAIDRLGQRTALDFVIVPPGRRGEAAITGTKTPASQAATPVDFGTYHALVIGNQDYANLPNLSTPANDAREVAALLRDRYGFKTQLLINATRYEILAALNELRAQLTDRDNLLIFYAGHGELDDVNLRGHWLPVDAEADSSANWISNIAITDVLNVMAAKHVMVIADSCYSGAMTRSGIARLETGLSSETKAKWYRTMSTARARAVLTSGGLKPVLDAGGGGHSIFTRALLDTLRDNQRILEGYALYREVQRRVKRAAAQLNVDQDPQYAPIKFAGHEAGEFFFLPSTARLSQLDLKRAGPEVAAR